MYKAIAAAILLSACASAPVKPHAPLPRVIVEKMEQIRVSLPATPSILAVIEHEHTSGLKLIVYGVDGWNYQSAIVVTDEGCPPGECVVGEYIKEVDQTKYSDGSIYLTFKSNRSGHLFSGYFGTIWDIEGVSAKLHDSAKEMKGVAYINYQKVYARTDDLTLNFYIAKGEYDEEECVSIQPGQKLWVTNNVAYVIRGNKAYHCDKAMSLEGLTRMWLPEKDYKKLYPNFYPRD